MRVLHVNASRKAFYIILYSRAMFETDDNYQHSRYSHDNIV